MSNFKVIEYDDIVVFCLHYTYWKIPFDRLNNLGVVYGCNSSGRITHIACCKFNSSGDDEYPGVSDVLYDSGIEYKGESKLSLLKISGSFAKELIFSTDKAVCHYLNKRLEKKEDTNGYGHIITHEYRDIAIIEVRCVRFKVPKNSLNKFSPLYGYTQKGFIKYLICSRIYLRSVVKIFEQALFQNKGNCVFDLCDVYGLFFNDNIMDENIMYGRLLGGVKKKSQDFEEKTDIDKLLKFTEDKRKTINNQRDKKDFDLMILMKSVEDIFYSYGNDQSGQRFDFVKEMLTRADDESTDSDRFCLSVYTKCTKF